MLRAGLDEAPVMLAEARTKLLDPEARVRIDVELHAKAVLRAVGEFKKIVSFAIIDKKLTPDAEERLYEASAELGLSPSESEAALEAELTRLGGVRAVAAALPAPRSRPVGGPPVEAAPSDPFNEFRRMLRLSKLCLDGDEMTDDQRDAMCNMGESLGLTGGQAEDVIDEYLEQMSNQPPPLSPIAAPRAVATVVAPLKPTASAVKPAFVATKTVVPTPVTPSKAINLSLLARAQEKVSNPIFTNIVGSEMLLVGSGACTLGSDTRDAAPHEQPLTPVIIGCFFMSKHPITNAQYERFDPAHRARRATWADDRHPVVFVSSRDAEKFCQWLSQRDGRKYRLPTEAEWEYAARGSDGRIYPWGDHLDAGHFANFADCRTTFPWRDSRIDDGYAESSPVDAFPRGASPFGIEDMSGNVCEWCLDYFEPYKGKERVNRRGPSQGTKRIYRGGSWKSRAQSLRASRAALRFT